MAVTYRIMSLNRDRLDGYAYYTVPAGTNIVGTSWQTCVAEHTTATRDTGTTSQAPALPTGVTQPDLDSGAFYEEQFVFEVDLNNDDATKEANLQAYLTAREAEITAELQAKLQFWGREGVTV